MRKLIDFHVLKCSLMLTRQGAAGPLLVMEYLEYGSLYDLLHNESFPFEMGMILTILKDVTLVSLIRDGPGIYSPPGASPPGTFSAWRGRI